MAFDVPPGTRPVHFTAGCAFDEAFEANDMLVPGKDSATGCAEQDYRRDSQDIGEMGYE